MPQERKKGGKKRGGKKERDRTVNYFAYLRTTKGSNQKRRGEDRCITNMMRKERGIKGVQFSPSEGLKKKGGVKAFRGTGHEKKGGKGGGGRNEQYLVK